MRRDPLIGTTGWHSVSKSVCTDTYCSTRWGRGWSCDQDTHRHTKKKTLYWIYSKAWSITMFMHAGRISMNEHCISVSCLLSKIPYQNSHMTFLHLIIDCEKLVHVSVVDHLLVGSWRMWRLVLTCQYPAMSRQALRRMWKTTMWWWSLDCLSSSSLNTVRTVWYNSWWGKIKVFAQQFMRVETVMIWYLDHYTRVYACRKLHAQSKPGHYFVVE